MVPLHFRNGSKQRWASKIVEPIVTTVCFFSQVNQAKKLYQSLTLRECEYLKYVRKKKMPMYGKLIRMLKEERVNRHKHVYEPEVFKTTQKAHTSEDHNY